MLLIFLIDWILRKPVLCLQNNVTGTPVTFCIFRQRELACFIWSCNASWISSWFMNANQHMHYNTSASAWHSFICGSHLDCTSVWPEPRNQCLQAAERMNQRFSSVKETFLSTWRLVQKWLHTKVRSQTGMACLFSMYAKLLRGQTEGRAQALEPKYVIL